MKNALNDNFDMQHMLQVATKNHLPEVRLVQFAVKRFLAIFLGKLFVENIPIYRHI